MGQVSALAAGAPCVLVSAFPPEQTRVQLNCYQERLSCYGDASPNAVYPGSEL